MKVVIFDKLFDTNKLVKSEFERFAQWHLDIWLGQDKVKFEVKQIADKSAKFTLWRVYGDWYEDPKRFSDCNEHLVDIDACIFLGTNYQVGTVADFTKHPGWCIWQPDIKTMFLPDMKAMAKKHHGSRIKNIEVDNNLDHIDITITYV